MQQKLGWGWRWGGVENLDRRGWGWGSRGKYIKRVDYA